MVDFASRKELTDEAPSPPGGALSLRPPGQIPFGRFVASPGARSLSLDGNPVEIGGRAFDLLIALLISRGQVVPKQTIIAYVWPTTTVDESNLRFQITVLRRALGPSRDLIKTIPGRGYLLAIEPEEHSRNAGAAPMVESLGPDGFDGQRMVCDALCKLLRAFGIQPAAVSYLETLLSARLTGPAAEPRSAELAR